MHVASREWRLAKHGDGCQQLFAFRDPGCSTVVHPFARLPKSMLLRCNNCDSFETFDAILSFLPLPARLMAQCARMAMGINRVQLGGKHDEDSAFI